MRDLARELKDHPAVAAYNIVNEPAPEKEGGLAEHASIAEMRSWYTRNADSSRDLRAFYETVISSIREVDPVTPVMADAGWYAAADAFSYWPAGLTDQRVLYSFHMYEPYAATSAPNMKRHKPYAYPGKVPFGEGQEKWDAERVKAYLDQPIDWADSRGIARNRVVAGEFGCMRRHSTSRRLPILVRIGTPWTSNTISSPSLTCRSFASESLSEIGTNSAPGSTCPVNCPPTTFSVLASSPR